MTTEFTPYDLVAFALSSATIFAAITIAERMLGNILTW